MGGKHEAGVAEVGGREETGGGDAEPSRPGGGGRAAAPSIAAGVRTREGALIAGITVLGVLVGRAEILGVLAPFSLAFMLATYCWYPRAALFALLGAVLGRGWLLGYSAGIEEALMLAAFWLSAELVAGNGNRTRDEAGVDMPRGLIGTAVGACALVRGLGRVWTGAASYDLLLVAFELIMVATSAAVFHQGLPSLLGFSERDDGLAPTISAGIIGGVVLLGTAGLGIGELRIIWVLATLIVLSFAGGGVLSGGGAGAVIGLIFGLCVHLDLSLAVVLLLGGAAAGLALRLGRPGAVIGFTGAVLLSSWILSSGTVVTPWELFAGVGIYLLNPLTLGRPAAREVAASRDPVRPGVRDALGGIACLWNIRPARKPRGGFFRRSDSSAPRRNRTGQDPDTSARLRSFARVFRRLADSFSEVTSAGDGVRSDQERAAGVIDIVGARVCRSCDRFSTCWQKRFMNTYHMFSEMLATFEIEDGRSVDRRVRKLQRHCKVRSEEVLETMEAAWRVQQIGVKWSSQFAETRDLAASQFRGIAEMMEDFAVSMEKGEDPRRTSGRGDLCMRYEAGVAAASRGGSTSGDSHVVRRLSAGELVVMLSDGMGSGQRARQESRAAVSLLEDLLELGLDRESALRTVNSVLVLRSTEEVFATVDLMSVDMTTGHAEFTKIGAAPTFVVRGRDVLCIPAQVVPIGILEDVSLESTRRILQPEDMVVMVTDGVMEALGDLTASQKRSWMSRFLASTRHECPEDLASAVVARAVSLCPDGVSDDMSVIAVKLHEG